MFTVVSAHATVVNYVVYHCYLDITLFACFVLMKCHAMSPVLVMVRLSCVEIIVNFSSPFSVNFEARHWFRPIGIL